MKKHILSFMVMVVMFVCMLPSVVLADNANVSGDVVRAYLNADSKRITVDMYNVQFAESVELKLYSGSELLTISALDTAEFGAGSYGELTGSVRMEATPDSTWKTETWEPVDGVVPTHVALCVDGTEVDTQELVVITAPETYRVVNADDWAAFPGTLGGDIARAYLDTYKGGRVIVDMTNVSYKESVALELYSGDKLLTTSTLTNPEYAGGGDLSGLTGAICVGGTSGSWTTEEWIAKENEIPTTVKLLIDGDVVDVCDAVGESYGGTSVSASYWEAFPETVKNNAIRAYLNASKSRITVDMDDIGFNESVTLQLYSGEQLLAEAKLDTAQVTPGKKAELTGVIGINDAGGCWPMEDWTALDSVVPTEVKVIVDGTVADTVGISVLENGSTRAMTEKDWVKYPGTLGVDVVRAYLNSSKSRITVDMANVGFNEGVALQLYCGDKLLTTANLDTTVVAPGHKSELTGVIGILDSGSSWPQEKWNALASEVPTEVRVVVDGVVTDSISLSVLDGQKAVPMTEEDWKNYTGTISGGIIRAYLNTEDTRITVDMSEVDYAEKVELKLYSGTRLLTTSALNTELYPAASRNELTGAICVQGDSTAWDQTSWSAKDNEVPTEVKLFVDDVEVASAPIVVLSGVEETTLMTSKDWAAFPGTAAPVVPSTPSYSEPETDEADVQETVPTVVADNNVEEEEEEVVEIEEEETPLAGGTTEATEQEEVVENTEATEETVQIEEEETPLAAEASEADSDSTSVAPALAAVAVLLLGVGSLVIVRKRNAAN